MKTIELCLACWLCLTATTALCADEGVFTIVEGGARALRDAKWYKLVLGARLSEGDIVEGAEASQVQVELVKGGTLNLVGPSTLYAASIPLRGESLAGPVELALVRGWMKLVANAGDAGIRVRTAAALASLREGVVVIRAEPTSIEVFVESGEMKISDIGANGKEGTPRDAKAGEYLTRTLDRPFATERRAPPAFVSAMPRHLVDPLPSLAAKYKGARVPLVFDHDVTYAEAAPWLQGPYRKSFVKRFQPRLQDREFRSGVDANIARYPEWDRILHPEKYLPKPPPTPPVPAPPNAAPAETKR